MSSLFKGDYVSGPTPTGLCLLQVQCPEGVLIGLMGPHLP